MKDEGKNQNEFIDEPNRTMTRTTWIHLAKLSVEIMFLRDFETFHGKKSGWK